MRAVCVLGSPRANGNTSILARRLCEGLVQRGVEVETFALNKMRFSGCQACMACKTRLEKCVLRDDLTEALESAASADVLILASPVYFGDVTSQLKGFIDRAYSWLVPDYRTAEAKSRLAPGKKLVFIQCQGRPDESKFADVFPRYEEFFEWYGFRERHLVRAWGIREVGDVKDRGDVLLEADEVAQIVAGP